MGAALADGDVVVVASSMSWSTCRLGRDDGAVVVTVVVDGGGAASVRLRLGAAVAPGEHQHHGQHRRQREHHDRPDQQRHLRPAEPRPLAPARRTRRRVRARSPSSRRVGRRELPRARAAGSDARGGASAGASVRGSGGRPGQLARRRVPVGGILRHALGDDVVERRVDPPAHDARPRRRREHVRAHHLPQVLGLERRPTGQAFVEQARQRVHVRRRAAGLAAAAARWPCRRTSR